MQQFSKYSRVFQKLRRDHKNGGAPHKPILLLSVLEQIENNKITSNQIFITPELIETFRQNWANLVTTNHSPRFALPFYHLIGDNFWHLVPNKGFNKILQLKAQMRSLQNLDAAVSYAYLDNELYLYLQNKHNIKHFKDILLNRYFPTTKHLYSDVTQNVVESIKLLENTILEEDQEKYTKSIELQEEEETVKRGTLFKRLVPRIYNYQCCISGFRVTSKFNIQLIDACHIKEFSKTQDDTIRNGITLCPNLHRAFDRGLITIDNNYQVVVSNQFIEPQQTPYGIKQFHGIKINLPKEVKYYPALANLRWHQENKFLT